MSWGTGLVLVPGPCGRLEGVQRSGQKLHALAGMLAMKMARREVMAGDPGENPEDRWPVCGGCQRWDQEGSRTGHL